MVSKTQLTTFIEKYYLSGSVEASILEIENKTLTTRFMLPAGDLLGKIEQKNIDIEDAEIGIYYTGILLKMLSILDNDIDIDLKKRTEDGVEKIVTLKVEDKKGKTINYATSDLELIERNNRKLRTIDYDIVIKLNQEILDDILKASTSIETNTITFLMKKKKMFVVFGYSKNNTNQIKFEIEADVTEDEMEPLSFSSVNIRNIFTANKKFEEGKIEITTAKKAMKVSFEGAETNSEYYLGAMNVD